MMEICRAFVLNGNAVSCERYGSGHINETYRVVTDKNQAYILQKINHKIFRDVPALMRNIEAVTAHLQKIDPEPRHSLHLVPTTDGTPFLAQGGEFYRVYDFVTGGICLDAPESEADFFESAVAFGEFQRKLADFPAERLSETIPRFHDTPNRCEALREAIKADPLGRLAQCRAEADFALARFEDAKTMVALQAKGELPLRVTHNDTKLNNVILDEKTRKPLCVIDLDTVMPGLAANDYGDSIRFGANTGAEDETDLSKVTLSLARCECYTRGFLSACGGALTPLERETLPFGAKLMTFECGVRFLTDYLSGDTYFHISRPGHNLDRTRTQFKLVSEMEKHWSEMNALVK